MSGACGECGFSGEGLGPADAVTALRGFARRYRAPLTRFLPGEDGDAMLRARPAGSTWSALEYAAHVRDVFASEAEGPPDCRETGPDERYNQLDPAAVADELGANAERLAATFEEVEEVEDERVLLRARRAVHEGNHHLLDIGRVLRTVREERKAGA